MVLRTPISRMRSLTNMVMVLIAESPPTISEMMAIRHAAITTGIRTR